MTETPNPPHAANCPQHPWALELKAREQLHETDYGNTQCTCGAAPRPPAPPDPLRMLQQIVRALTDTPAIQLLDGEFYRCVPTALAEAAIEAVTPEKLT